MNLTEQNIDQLEAFWEGTLPEPEHRALAQRLQSDEDFRRAADRLHLTLLGLQSLRERRLRRWMDETDSTLPPIPPLPVVRPIVQWDWWVYNARPLRIAAALALLLAVCAWWLLRPGQTAEQQLVAGAFEPYPILGITLGADA